MTKLSNALADMIEGYSFSEATARNAVAAEDLATALGSMRKTQGVYALICPLTQRLRYVGSSNDCFRRRKQHQSVDKSAGNLRQWMQWLTALNTAQKSIICRILEVVEDESMLRLREHAWLKHYRRLGLADLNSHQNPAGK